MGIDLELAQAEGALAVKQQSADALRLRVERLRDSIRSALPPYLHVEDLHLEAVAAQAVEASECQAELKGLLAEIGEIKKILGRR